MIAIEQNLFQEKFLDDTLILAWFNPNEDDFEVLKYDMRPILEEYLILNLYKILNEADRAEFNASKANHESLDEEGFFKSKIPDFQTVRDNLYSKWQAEYLNMMKEN